MNNKAVTMNNKVVTFAFRPWKKHFLGIILSALVAVLILFGIGGYGAIVPITVILVISTISPFIGILTNRKYRILINKDIVEGYDFNERKRVSFKINEIELFGIIKGSSNRVRIVPFSSYDHSYIKCKKYLIQSLLHPSDLEFFIKTIENKTNKKSLLVPSDFKF